MLQARDGGCMFMVLGQGLLAPCNCLWVGEEACRGLQGSAPQRPSLFRQEGCCAWQATSLSVFMGFWVLQGVTRKQGVEVGS